VPAVRGVAFKSLPVGSLLTGNTICGPRYGSEALPPKLDPALYAGWEKKWAVKAERFELEGGTGKVVTEKENKTGADNSAKLTQDDPPPQTLYRIAAKPGSAVLVEIPLQLKK
jgi:hypothetical protein